MLISLPAGAVPAGVPSDIRLQIVSPCKRPLAIKPVILLAAAVALPCTALAQSTDYRITEATQACERLELVHTSVENAKHGIGGSRLGCTSVPKGTEVSLITRKDDVTQVVFCTVDGCLPRWVLTSVLGPKGI
jgi:hypothetical protein